jgi:hypothetical protein
MSTPSNNSASAKAKELLQRYLQAVRFWLPKAQQEDILAELSEDLRSQIDDKETEVGHPLDEAELGAILKKCGNPMRVASRFQSGQYLIGPTWFPIYRFVLKLVLLWILIPVFVVIVGPAIVLSSPNRVASIIQIFANLWTAEILAGGVITLVFAILERVQVKCDVADKWDPRSLPPLAKEQVQSGTKSICEIAFGILGLMWLLLVPQYPVLAFGPAAAFLKVGPVWQQFYIPMILLSLFGLAHQIIGLARPQWTWLPPAGRLLTTALTLIVLKYVIAAAGLAPHTEWHPFVVLADGVRDSLRYGKIVAVVNVSLLLSIAGTWLGLCIAAVIQTWQFVRLIRKRMPQGHNTAPFRAA